MIRELAAIAVTLAYIVAAYVAVSPAGAVVFGVAGGVLAHLVLRPGLSNAVLDEDLTPYSPTVEKIVLSLALIGGLVGFGAVAVFSG